MLAFIIQIIFIINLFRFIYRSFLLKMCFTNYDLLLSRVLQATHHPVNLVSRYLNL